MCMENSEGPKTVPYCTPYFTGIHLQPKFRKCWDVFLNLNKMKTKRNLKSHEPIFIHNRT